MINKDNAIQDCLKAIKDNNLLFADELFSYVAISKTYFYESKLNETDSIKEALIQNRLIRKKELREKWYKSDNATLQIALYKLLAEPEELQRLNGTKQELIIENKTTTPPELAPDIKQMIRNINNLDAIEQPYAIELIKKLYKN